MGPGGPVRESGQNRTFEDLSTNEKWESSMDNR